MAGAGSGVGPRLAGEVESDTNVERWPTGTFARAEQLIAQHRFREAIMFCRQELAASPRCVTLRLLLARALLADGSGAAGVAQLEECMRIDPSAADARTLLVELGVEPPPLPRKQNRPPSITPLPPPPSVPPLRAVAPKPRPTAAPRLVAEPRPAPQPQPRAPASPRPAPQPRPPARPTPQPAMRATALPAHEPLRPPPKIVYQAPIAPIAPSPRVVYSSPAMASQPALAARVATAEILMPPPLEPPPLEAAPLSPSMFELPKLQPLKAPPVRVAHDPPGRARQRRRRGSFSSPFVEAPKASRAGARWERPLSIEQRRPQPLFRLGVAAIAIAGLLALWRLGRDEARSLPTVAMAAASRPTPEPPIDKPAAPPLDGLAGGDLWIHPLAGPERRMPERDSRLFGAERVGDRPSECRGGHCGVDLAGAYGEPVYAVHDGVVDRVQRALNPDHGGRYVRLAHRDGTIITQYFHLSEIPRRIVEGAAVKAGDVVGFVGLTGVKHSEPHLHFTIEVQDPSGHEARYLDPEPLVALWPLRVSSKGDDRLRVSTAPPGLARGFLRRRHRHHAAAEAD